MTTTPQIDPPAAGRPSAGLRRNRSRRPGFHFHLAALCLGLLAGSSQAAPPPQQAGAAEAGAPAADAAAIKVTYTGNEGFLLEVGGTKILVDALYREGVEGYVAPAASQSEAMENGTPPFDGIDLALTSHYHADHFHPQAVGEFLTQNSDAVFISTTQARVALEKVYPGYAGVAGRVRGLLPQEGAPVTETVNDITVEVFNLHHGRRRPVENLGFLIHAGGRSILHMGDTESTTTDLEPLALPDKKIDLAFVPFWYLVPGSWRETIKLAVAPREIVVMHLPAPDQDDPYIESLGGWEKVTEGIKQAYPNATVFRQPLASARF